MRVKSNTTRVATLGFALPFLSSLLMLPARNLAQEILHQFTSDSCYGSFGSSISSAGDLNGDGVQDLMVGNPSSYPGRVFVYSGSDGSQLYLLGTSYYTSFGRTLAGGGDVDADGIFDLCVGAYNRSGDYTGSVLLFSGATGRLLYSIDSAEEILFGAAISFIDDLDGDASADLLIGAPGAAHDGIKSGGAFLYSGANGSLIGFVSRGTYQASFGRTLASVGDVNGDGASDFVVGAPYDNFGGPESGSVYLISGRDLTVLRRFDAEPGSGLRFGYVVAAVGDVDRDHVPDFVVGTFSGYEGWSGLAYVYSGADRTLLYRLDSDVETDWFGVSVGGGLDLNLDGHSDILVGAPRDGWESFYSGAHGAMYAFSGRDGDLLFSVRGTYLGGSYGTEVAALGDVNSDAFPEIIVAAPHCQYGGGEFPHVDVISGRVAPTIEQVLPPRSRYDRPGEVLVLGDHFRYFQEGEGTTILFGPDAASDVVILDDDTIRCTVPPGIPGTVDVQVENLSGVQLLTDGLIYTPAIDSSASTVSPGERVALHYLCDPGDFIYAIVGAGAPVSIPTPPFDGTLCISHPVTLFLLPSWPFDDLYLEQRLPDDPALSGLTILLQALIGPVDYRDSLNASWTNCVELLVE